MNSRTVQLFRRAHQYGTLTMLALGVLAAPTLVRAQSAIIYGSLGNFDISNDTGKVCHGFEIDLEGVTAAQVPASFSAQRYGAASMIPYAGGVWVRWASPYTTRRCALISHVLSRRPRRLATSSACR